MFSLKNTRRTTGDTPASLHVSLCRKRRSYFGMQTHPFGKDHTESIQKEEATFQS